MSKKGKKSNKDKKLMVKVFLEMRAYLMPALTIQLELQLKKMLNI